MPTYNPGQGFIKGRRGFGRHKHPITGKIAGHSGQDWPAAARTPIPAAYDGVVERNEYQYNPKTGVGWGNFVQLSHTLNGKKVQTRYAHLVEKSPLSVGAPVKKGEPVGLVGSTGGSTGPHLHFEVLVEDAHVNPDDFDFPDSTTDAEWSFPFKNSIGKKPITNALYFFGAPLPIVANVVPAMSRADNGFFPIGANGLWHGGIHFDAATGGLLDQSEGVRCMRAGEVVAYFVDKEYPEIEFNPGKKRAAYSRSFTLVKHTLEVPELPKDKHKPAVAKIEAKPPWSFSSWAPASPPSPPMLGPVGSATTGEGKKEKEKLTFYSLYMHQLDWSEYERNPKLPRPAYWSTSTTKFIVGTKAKDKQGIAPTPLNSIDASERPPADELLVLAHEHEGECDNYCGAFDDDPSYA